MYIVQCTSHRA